METRSYKIICKLIKIHPVTADQMTELKNLLKIHLSNRQIARISSTTDIIKILENQDVINESNISVLTDFNKIFRNHKITVAINNFIPQVCNSGHNLYAISRQEEISGNQIRFDNFCMGGVDDDDDREPSQDIINEEYPTRPQQQFNTTKETLDRRTREIIYNYICSEIGRKWRQFGRELDIREGELDCLCDDYRHLSERVRKVLELVEQKGLIDPRQMPLHLCNALVKCGRDDMRYKIQEILSRQP